MTAEERNLASNLMLLCASNHNEIDQAELEDVTPVEWLARRKAEHEAWIRQLVTLPTDRRTAILRMVGTVGGSSPDLTHERVIEAIVRNGARYPRHRLSYADRGVEIDLREMPGEHEGSRDYWNVCRRKIDEVIDHKLGDAVRGEHVRHVSVFAFARLPLLIYLGSKLDDTFEVEIYQRRRASQRWDWDDEAPAVSFDVRAEGDHNHVREALLVLNVSGSVNPSELPQELACLPRSILEPTSADPGEDIVASRRTLAAFEATARQWLSRLERDAKTLRRLHVVGALPVSAAVAFGRLHHRGVHPALTIYARDSSRGYSVALELE